MGSRVKVNTSLNKRIKLNKCGSLLSTLLSSFDFLSSYFLIPKNKTTSTLNLSFSFLFELFQLFIKKTKRPFVHGRI